MYILLCICTAKIRGRHAHTHIQQPCVQAVWYFRKMGLVRTTSSTFFLPRVRFSKFEENLPSPSIPVRSQLNVHIESWSFSHLTMERVAEPAPSLACTTSSPPNWMRWVRALMSSSENFAPSTWPSPPPSPPAPVHSKSGVGV